MERRKYRCVWARASVKHNVAKFDPRACTRLYRELKQTKSSMEQKMKQAFLRSVKSLNIEAFQLVNELDAPVAAIEGPQ